MFMQLFDMKYILCFLIIGLSGCSLQGKISDPEVQSSGRWMVWSKKPSTIWEDAFVTGNGRHGTMVLGQPGDERIICVHEELFIRGWDHNKETVPVTADLLPEVRCLIDEGKNNQASGLIADEADRQLVGMGAKQRWPLIPHPAFDLRIQYPDRSASVNGKYRRQLDLETGVASVFYDEENGMTESVFSSRKKTIFPQTDGRKHVQICLREITTQKLLLILRNIRIQKCLITDV